MARAAWPPDARDPGPFDPRLKCCTYLPFLPNFVIGQLLREGRHEERLAMAAKTGRLTPLGLLPQDDVSSTAEFGRDPGARCPFLGESAESGATAQGVCTIWRHRPSVCRSYFCVSDEGADGQAKWARAERDGNEAEWTLAHEILWELGFTDDEIGSRTWLEWRGRENEFFLRCAELAPRIRR